MSLRIKALLVTGAILVGLIAILYYISILILGTSVSQDQRYLLSSLLFAGLIFGLANRAVLNGFILSRLNRLSADIKGIVASGNLTARLVTSGDDELARLARHINGMLGALEKSQQQRLESEQRYRAVVQETEEGIFLLDTETKRVLESNAAFQKLVGYTAEELMGLTLYDLVAHERASIDENIERLLAEKRQSFGERKYRRKSGSLVVAEISASVLTYGGRQVACVVVRDGTQRKWAEDALRRNEAYFHPLIDNSLDVPYCHHEKWDGTGYPRGLKGEQIQLAARIFAVADVWDALRSDRPYRGAWPEDQVYTHIRDQSGKHLDPKVVEEFLKIDTGTWRGGNG